MTLRIAPSPTWHGAPLAPSAVTWHPPGNKVQIGDYSVRNGMVYVVTGGDRRSGVEACVIDPGLAVGTPAAARPLREGTSYRDMTPACRGAYLAWLADGKCAPSIDSGYVMLYFQGLERRLLIDRPPTGETLALVAELGRLKTLYAAIRSFAGCNERLLEAVYINGQLAGGGSGGFSPDQRAAAGEMPADLNFAIAWELAAGRGLSLEIAAAGLIGLRGFGKRHSALLSTDRSAFLARLSPCFAAAFPGGFVPRDQAGVALRLPYRGATAGLTVDLAANSDLRDPRSLNWTELTQLGDAVAREIETSMMTQAGHKVRGAGWAGIGPPVTTVGKPPMMAADPIPSEGFDSQSRLIRPPAGLDRHGLRDSPAQTARTDRLLARHFADEQAPAPVPPAGRDRHRGALKAPHATWVIRLLGRPRWNRAEFDAVAVAADLMPDGAMAEVNEWACEHWGENLLEDGASVTVNATLVPRVAAAIASSLASTMLDLLTLATAEESGPEPCRAKASATLRSDAPGRSSRSSATSTASPMATAPCGS